MLSKFRCKFSHRNETCVTANCHENNKAVMNLILNHAKTDLDERRTDKLLPALDPVNVTCFLELGKLMIPWYSCPETKRTVTVIYSYLIVLFLTLSQTSNV